MNIRTPKSGNAARIAKAYLKTLGIELKHAQALELVARLHGYTDNQAMQSDPNFQDPLALVAEGSTDFKMVGPRQSSVYITVENISVYVKRDDEGVSVDLFPLGREMEESLAGTWATYDEAKSEEGEDAPSDLQQLLDRNVSNLSADVQRQGFDPMDLDELVHEHIGGPRASSINNEGLFGQLMALLQLHLQDTGRNVRVAWRRLVDQLQQELEGYEAFVEFDESPVTPSA